MRKKAQHTRIKYVSYSLALAAALVLALFGFQENETTDTMTAGYRLQQALGDTQRVHYDSLHFR